MPSNALHHLAATYRSTIMECPLIASPLDPLNTRNWEAGESTALLSAKFPNEFLTWLSKPSKISLPLASTSTLTSHPYCEFLSFSGMHLSLWICPCLHIQKWDGLYTGLEIFLIVLWTPSRQGRRTIPESTALSKEWGLMYIFDWNNYSCPLNNKGLNWTVHLYTDFFFNKYLYYYFWSEVRGLQKQRLYALIYLTWYRRFQDPWILVSGWGGGW